METKGVYIQDVILPQDLVVVLTRREIALEVFGSAARGEIGPYSDVDLLVTLDDSVPVSTADLLDMAGEAEELVGAPVDFVLRPSLEKSPNRFAREHILSTAVCIYGS